MRNSKIAAAVAAVLATGGFVAAQAATPPTPAQASAAAHKVYIAGSSAAAAGVVSYLETTVFGGTYSQFTTPTSASGLPDFRAVSGTPVSGQPFAGSTLTVWYRPEGGSVVGVLPVINNVSIKQMDIQNASCVQTNSTTATGATFSCTGITGSAANNGTDDSWGGGVLSHNVDIGVSDLEPMVFGNLNGNTSAWAGGGNHDPVGTYSSAFTGPDHSVDDLSAMTHAIVFQQTFGFVVSSNLGISDLPKAAVAGIYDGLITNWNQVTTSANTAVPSGTIIVCNREIGSGTRAEADIFLNGTGCNTVGTVNTLVDVSSVSGQPANNYQTIAELDCVNRQNNAIGYVSVDNFSKVGAGKSFPNTVSITVSGITDSALNGALGITDDVYEASLNENPSPSSDGSTFYTALVPSLQNVNSTSNSAQISAIPGLVAANKAQSPLQTGSPSGVKTSDFTRGAAGGGNSCTPLTD
jgi:ABC-type phosphate transport system substrate-binding protein